MKGKKVQAKAVPEETKAEPEPKKKRASKKVTRRFFCHYNLVVAPVVSTSLRTRIGTAVNLRTSWRSKADEATIFFLEYHYPNTTFAWGFFAPVKIDSINHNLYVWRSVLRGVFGTHKEPQIQNVVFVYAYVKGLHIRVGCIQVAVQEQRYAKDRTRVIHHDGRKNTLTKQGERWDGNPWMR